jgi:hypothetical protein
MDSKIAKELRVLKAYAVVSSLLIIALFVMGAANERKKEKFDEIDVQRINVIEPDGTLRMVISNQAAFPGLIIKKKEYPHEDRKTAGILFFNEEGSENGGLIFGGSQEWPHTKLRPPQFRSLRSGSSSESGSYRRRNSQEVWPRHKRPARLAHHGHPESAARRVAEFPRHAPFIAYPYLSRPQRRQIRLAEAERRRRTRSHRN